MGFGNLVGMYWLDFSFFGFNDFEIKVFEKKIDFLGFFIMKISVYVWRVFVGDSLYKLGWD